MINGTTDPVLHFINGDNLFVDEIFKYDNLIGGKFQHFVCPGNFEFDSDIFNQSLSSFTQQYNSNGHFYIARYEKLAQPLLIDNSFNPALLSQTVDSFDEVMRYVPTFFCDAALQWSIFLDNDLDIFISWTKEAITEMFDRNFKFKNEDFFFEPNTCTFISIAINQLSFKKDFDEKSWTEAVQKKNFKLFV